jgi:hypothetical protein
MDFNFSIDGLEKLGNSFKLTDEISLDPQEIIRQTAQALAVKKRITIPSEDLEAFTYKTMQYMFSVDTCDLPPKENHLKAVSDGISSIAKLLERPLLAGSQIQYALKGVEAEIPKIKIPVAAGEIDVSSIGSFANKIGIVGSLLYVYNSDNHLRAACESFGSYVLGTPCAELGAILGTPGGIPGAITGALFAGTAGSMSGGHIGGKIYDQAADIYNTVVNDAPPKLESLF